jgi:hypothetical protein
LTDSSCSDGQGPILQAYPFCERSTPEKEEEEEEEEEAGPAQTYLF